MTLKIGKWRVKLSFVWYDLWIGVYVKRNPLPRLEVFNRHIGKGLTELFICPLPCCLIHIWQDVPIWAESPITAMRIPYNTMYAPFDTSQIDPKVMDKIHTELVRGTQEGMKRINWNFRGY